MFAKIEDFAQIRQTNIDNAVLFANTAFENVERLTALNLNTARAVFEDSVANLNALLNVRDPQALIELQKGLAQPAIEKSLAYSRNVYEITAQAKDTLAKAVESQLADANAQVIQFVDAKLKAAPAGSEAAVAVVKSVISAANNAYESLNQAAKQVTDIAEANIATATESVTKVVGGAVVATPATKKAAKKAA